jgi:2-C-methyl-D-erythritol 2,4-cyclodiphosphate synthase
MRIGHGFDVHPLVTHRPLMLGGILIPYHQGLLGHSDGDCLLHAICDALLGAAGLGDIGQHFPPGDPAFKDIDSKILLARVYEKIRTRWQIANIDATILAERPKLSTYFETMRQAIATVIAMDATDINIKATTTEGLGFVGRKEGIAAHAVCLLVPK